MRTHIITLKTAREIVKARQEQTKAAKKEIESLRALCKSKWERSRHRLNVPAVVPSIARVMFKTRAGSGEGETHEGLLRILALREWIATAKAGEQWAFCDFGYGEHRKNPGLHLQRGTSGLRMTLGDSDPEHGDFITLESTPEGEFILAKRNGDVLGLAAK